MNWIEAFVLGLIQGLTEFLPVSSSGHLVLVQHLMGLKTSGVLLEVVLHMGTLVAIIIFYYNDLHQLISSFIRNQDNSRKYILNLLIASIPAICFGFILKDSIDTIFAPKILPWMFLISGLFIGITYFFQNKPRKQLTILIAFYIGLAQAFSLFPGISRSGLTISIALILGLKHDKATKFAFLMAIPVLIGAGFIQIITFEFNNNVSLIPLLVGFVTSLFTGYIVINWLLSVISRGKFYLFSLYCFFITIITFIIIN